MRQVIYKYQLENEFTTLMLPYQSRPLCFQNQNNKMCLWVLLDLDKPVVTRRFQLIGTGEPADNLSYVYIGSCQIEGFIMHLFEIT